MAKVIGLGNALVDIMTVIDSDNVLEKLNLPKGSMQLVDSELSEKIQLETSAFPRTMASGGSAANTIRSLANMGIETGYVGKIGPDEVGDFFASDMKRTGVLPRLIKSETPSGRAVALVSQDSERTFATYLGAAAEMTADDINATTFLGYDILHVEGYLIINHELIEKAMSLAKENGLKVSLDLASYNVVEENLEFLRYLIEKYVDIVFANEEEAAAFTDGNDPETALDMISTLCDIAVVKIGKHGAWVKHGNYKDCEPEFPAKRVDTTAAGDNFAAGFIYGLVNNWSLDKCVKAGNIIAGNVIEVVGATMDAKRWTRIKDEIAKLA
ncbi:MAG: adenosine kinase [Bacteroidales bacterium]|nr:adenosine kinase [Bacteroidales bacterium]